VVSNLVEKSINENYPPVNDIPKSPPRPHIIIRKKQRKYAVAMIRVAEEARRAVRVMERNTEVVFRIRICSLDLLLLLHQGKRRESSRIPLPNGM
jgi:hypothetical protein